MPNFGEIEGYLPGTQFDNRKELSASGIPPPTQAGISGRGAEGADSIVLSGGFEDDEDHGDVIIYTGAGGRDPNSGQQVADQVLTRWNLALAKSSIEGLPVRVTRGSNHRGEYSPDSGYRYDGVYYVADYWIEAGISGFSVCRYRLVRSLSAQPLPDNNSPDQADTARRSSTVLRIVRDTKLSKAIKKLHAYRCQVCGLAIETSAGLYAEAAHIQPLGRPHDGPDIAANIICLCPNHHVLFDHGGFSITDDLELVGLGGLLRVVPNHLIGVEFLRYHREHYLREE